MQHSGISSRFLRGLVYFGLAVYVANFLHACILLVQVLSEKG
jgi:hypothetical protein